MEFIRRPSEPFRPVSLAACAVALAVAQGALAQAQIQPQRIGGSAQSAPRGGVSGGINRNSPGLGNALGDGTGMGGQTFSWTRGVGAGRSLGSGNRLDANSQVGSGGTNTSSQPWVNGGVSSRGLGGAMGYVPGSDLGPQTRSEPTTNFERYGGTRTLASEVGRATAGNATQLGSGLTTPGVRNDRFLIAQGLGIFEYPRATTPVGLDSLQRASSDFPSNRVMLDRANAGLAFGGTNLDVGEDRIVARGQAANGEPIRYIVSPLRGLQAESLNDPFVQSGLGIYEQARARRDVNLGLMSMDDVRKMQAAQRGQMQLQSMNDVLRVKESRIVPQNYLDIVEGVEKSAGARPELAREAPEDRLRTIQDSIDARLKSGATAPGATTAPAPEAPAAPGEGEAPAPDETAPGEMKAPDGGEALREEKRVEERGKLLSIPEVAEILRHGKTIEELGREEKQRVNELIVDGQNFLRKGDYFQAERRFTQAQDLAAGNPLVEVGIAHAQLGAGLHLSAALTLRNLFEAHPVLIDARYAPELLPSGERLAELETRLRERVRRGEDAPSYGFLLAYIGHQTGDKALVGEGLEAIAGSERLETERELLAGIWLGTK